MRLVLQRVRSASVRVAGEMVGGSAAGLLVLVGVERGDGPAEVRAAAEKLAGLRVFEDAAGKMNLDAAAVGGAFLVVSQFTLAGSLARGRRPSFDRAAPPEEAEPLVEALVADLRGRGFRVETGRFRAHMEVELVNDGPVTCSWTSDAQPRGSASGPRCRRIGTGMKQSTKISSASDARARRPRSSGSLSSQHRRMEEADQQDDARTRAASPARGSRSAPSSEPERERQPALPAGRSRRRGCARRRAAPGGAG